MAMPRSFEGTHGIEAEVALMAVPLNDSHFVLWGGGMEEEVLQYGLIIFGGSW